MMKEKDLWQDLERIPSSDIKKSSLPTVKNSINRTNRAGNPYSVFFVTIVTDLFLDYYNNLSYNHGV